MTQEFIPSTVTVREMFAHGDSASYEDSVAAFDRWLAAHDAQIRAEALDFANAEQIENGEELLNESLSEVVEEYLLYGDHPLSTEEDSDDIWDDAELYNLKLTNGDVIDCSELAGEVLDALKRYLKGQPMLQSIPVKEQKQ